MPFRTALGCLLGIVLTAAPAAAQFDPEAVSWSSRCETLRETLASNPNTAVTYTERPQALPMAEVWTLHAHGFHVPVPSGTYTDVVVNREGNEPVSVILVGLRQTAVIVASMPMEPMEDIFAGTDWVSDSIASAERIAWTNDLFGGPVDLSELTDLGYRSTAADLTCNPDAWRTEIPIAIALILKGAGPGQLVHVYPTTGEERGWLTDREVEGQQIWEASRIEPGRVWFANLSGPVDGPMRDLGLAIDHPDLAPAPGQPAWLGALEHALEADDASSWQALADTLAAEGLSGRSVEAARAVAASARTSP